ncbi:MAG TPA: aminotransferase class I/II-fold pyridoxal phosphate-dependent enzyme [Puia sp.]|nr:aminotransferase class I/II-fold pyridoxal phosphate-dependent enzyme [Puia sp.]
MLHGHGDHGGRVVADFSTNVWYGGEPSGLKEYLFGQWERIHHYPEVSGGSLATRAARHHGVSPGNILITNGAVESIYLLAQAFSGRRSAIVTPSFSEYEDACRMHAHQLTFIPWPDLDKQQKLPELLWLGNPNNPTGAVITNMEPLLQHHPDTLFVVDEAFIEFTRAIGSLTPLLARYPNLVILRSLTKSFTIPGLRLGYTMASPKIIHRLQSLKMPWSVNSLALAAGHFIFDNYTVIPLDQLLQNKDIFQQQLRALHLHIYESHTHYFLCRTEHGPVQELQQYLLNERHIAIRNAENFRGLGPGHFRLATRTSDQNQLLINALKEWSLPCA